MGDYAKQVKSADRVVGSNEDVTNFQNKTMEARRKEKSNRSFGNNESQKFRQLSSHNDSFEYTVMNLNRRSNTKNWRLFLIRHVILPQRTKRIYLNTIHSVFSGDFRGLCSTNILNCYVTIIVVFILIHVVLLNLAVYMALEKEKELRLEHQYWNYLNVLLLLMTGVYPIVIAVLAVVMLVQNLLCTVEYENMFVWHRNSLFRYVQWLFGYTCLVASQIKNITLTKNGEWEQDDIIARLNPILTLAVLVLVKTLLVRHKNQRTATVMAVCILTQYFMVLVSPESIWNQPDPV